MGYYREPCFNRKEQLKNLYYCLRCERLLSEEALAIHTEHGEFWGSPYSETTKVCPYCKDEVIHLTKKCDCCGEYITGEYIETNDKNYYCENCYVKGDVTEDDD